MLTHPRQNLSALLLALLLPVLPPAYAGTVPPRTAPEVTTMHWLNSEPLTLEKLRGQVVLVEFWTFACWNCQHVEPFMKQWHERYKDQGLTIVAVHTPELDHERVLENVKKYLVKDEITYPVAIDNDYAIWRRYENRYWPALYLIDKQGNIRYQHFGEGQYKETETRIRKLLAEDKPEKASESGNNTEKQKEGGEAES